MTACPKCGAEVTEEDNFCPECGFNLKTSEKSETTNGGSKMKKLGIIIGILIALCGVLVFPISTTETYTTKEPYTTIEHRSESLLDDTYTIPAGEYKVIPIYIDISGKDHILVSGVVRETAGYDIKFYVIDSLSSKYYYGPYRLSKRKFGFVPDHTDTYYFYLDNTYSLFTNKVPRITITMSWEEKVTKYREVQKQRTVSKPIYQIIIDKISE